MTKPAPSYRPLALSDQQVEAWAKRYRHWVVSNVHPQKRRSAPPEVYDLIRTSIEVALADQELTRRGFYELTPDEQSLSEKLLTSPEGRLRQIEGPARVAFALDSLRISNPQLADRLTGPSGYHLLTFYKWAEFLATKPA